MRNGLRQTRKKRNAMNCFPQTNLILIVLFFCIILSEALQASSVSAGQKIYNRCIACHSLSYNRTGPKHCGLFGRRAGTVKDYEYSNAMKASHVVWNNSTLDAFLESPLDYIPGTNMGYAGIKVDTERADLIAYLQQVTQSNECK